MSRPRTAVVVAPFGTGQHYAAAFGRDGVRTIAVTPPESELPRTYHGALDPTQYHRVITHTSARATASVLRGENLVAIVAGTEIGVPLADSLAHALGLPGNAPTTSAARRDKGAMAAALAAAGVEGPLTLATASAADAVAWVREHQLTEVVVKPPNSAGSDGVRFADGAKSLHDAFRSLHGKSNALGYVNTALVVQEVLTGPQRVVNTASVTAAPGEPPVHTVTEMWDDQRTGGQLPGQRPILYDRLDLLREDAPEVAMLTDYIRRVLDAVGIAVGPAHAEVVLTTRGVRLIEVGARPEGAYPPDVMRALTGSDHVQDTVTALLTGRVLRPTPPPYPPHVTKLSLISPVYGHLNGDLLPAVLGRPTVAGYHGDLTPGRRVHQTHDLLTSPARLVLACEDPALITADVEAIRRLERSGLYQPAVLSTQCAR